MKSVCVFVHYGYTSQLPYPEEAYVRELAKYFSEIILVTNRRQFDLGDLPATVSLKLVENEGYDFGMFYKVAQEMDWENLDRLALANDSNLLIRSLSALFKMGEKLKVPFWGAIDSHEKPWFSTHADNYHLQSHFLVWEKAALPLLKAFLDRMPIGDFFMEKNLKNLRRKVINDWEIGISQFYIENRIKVGAAFSSDPISSTGYRSKQSKSNNTMKTPEALLQAGYPFLKKKVLTKPGFLRRIFFPDKKWVNLINSYSFDSLHAERLLLFSVKK